MARSFFITFLKGSALAIAVASLGLLAVPGADAAKTLVPPPLTDSALASSRGEQTVVFSGGCFWGIQAVFQHVKGVVSARSGYSGGERRTAEYEMVSTGRTGHAESVKVVFDPSQVTYGQLLHVFFSVAHDPTQLNRQGPDEGSQYRSVVFYTSEEQERITKAYIAQLEEGHVFKHRIVTEVVPLKAFYEAEAYHQDYATHHPESPYIQYNDLPKVDHLKKEFPQLWAGK